MKHTHLATLMAMFMFTSISMKAQETLIFKRSLWSAADRKSWTLTASSAQSLSDGGNGGPASLLTDGLATTYWHSVWDTAVVPGATVDVDFGTSQYVTGVLFQQRTQENRRLKDIKIYFKNSESASWTLRYTGSLENNSDQQKITLSSTALARYMRIYVTSKIDGTATNACLAELGIEVKETFMGSEYNALKNFLDIKTAVAVDKSSTAQYRALCIGSEPRAMTPILTPSLTGLTVTNDPLEKAVGITTNINKWNATKTAEWLTLDEIHQSGANQLKVKVAANTTLVGRSDTINLYGAGLNKKISVEQSGILIPDSLLLNDKYLTIIGGKSTSSYSPSHTITNLWDRNTTDGYNFHSAVNNTASTVTESLEFYFNKPETIDYLVYYPAGAGNFKKLSIWAKCGDETEYTLVGNYDWGGSGSVRKFSFPTELKKPTAVKLVLDVDPNGGLIAAKEVEFWAINNDESIFNQLATVFEDVSCSSLRSDVTTDAINALPAYYRTIAERLQAGTYQNKYRIASYKAFSNPDTFASLRNTNAYSILDNPTGIYANEGDEVYVLVGDTHGQEISLCSVSPGSINRSTYSLKKGPNKIKINRTGLLYVMYMTDLTTSPQPINIHIPEGSGIVNGYWDIAKNTGSEWKDILNNSTFQVMDIVGKNTMMTLWTDELKANLSKSDDISKSVEIWDAMIESEWKIMGFDKYPLPQNNRMYGMSFNDPGSAPMWATWYTTGYNKYTLANEVLYPGVVSGTKLWGLGHETGHCNQHPFNLKSMSESSNNFFAQVALDQVITKKVRNISDDASSDSQRDNTSTDMENPCPYLTKAAQGTAFHDLDGWAKWGGMYYQFYLYFHKLGINDQFYPDMFESLRQTGLGDDYYVAIRHLNWYKRVCDLTKTDFTEHFQTYGYFTPFSTVANQYGAYEFTLTKAMADEAIAYVKSKNYPKPKYRTQFMHQHGKIKPVTSLNGYWTYYRDNAQINSNISCTKNGTTVTVTNGAAAAAFAVETDGKIVAYYDRASFTVDASVWNDTTSKIYAIPIQTDQPYIQIYPSNK